MKIELELPDWLLEDYLVEIGRDPYDGTMYLNVLKERNFEAEEVKKIKTALEGQFSLYRIFVRTEGVEGQYIVLHFVEKGEDEDFEEVDEDV